MKRLLVIFFLLFVTTTAFGQANEKQGIIVVPTFSFVSDTSVSEGNRTQTLIDFRAGYVNDINMYFGAIFTHQNGSGANGYNVNQTTLGNSLGYFLGNFGAIFSLHLTARRNESSNASQNVTLSEGIGYQFDLIYFFPLSGWFSLEAVLSHRSIDFNKEEIGGNLIETSRNVSHFQPFLGFMVHF